MNDEHARHDPQDAGLLTCETVYQVTNGYKAFGGLRVEDALGESAADGGGGPAEQLLAAVYGGKQQLEELYFYSGKTRGGDAFTIGMYMPERDTVQGIMWGMRE